MTSFLLSKDYLNSKKFYYLDNQIEIEIYYIIFYAFQNKTSENIYNNLTYLRNLGTALHEEKFNTFSDPPKIKRTLNRLSRQILFNLIKSVPRNIKLLHR